MTRIAAPSIQEAETGPCSDDGLRAFLQKATTREEIRQSLSARPFEAYEREWIMAAVPGGLVELVLNDYSICAVMRRSICHPRPSALRGGMILGASECPHGQINDFLLGKVLRFCKAEGRRRVHGPTYATVLDSGLDRRAMPSIQEQLQQRPSMSVTVLLEVGVM